MKLAIKWENAQVDETGRVSGHSAGDTLVRRVLRNFPDSIL
ncbi:glycosyltransferase family 1 protein, partial [Mobiluncus curtisii]|nr:glycosyltransferase family 1 protein [Mobiluncus curtisii]